MRQTRLPTGLFFVTAVAITVDIGPLCSYINPISPIEGASTGDSRLMGRVRFLRAGLVTPLPGGLGIGSAAIMTGPRGASLDWDRVWRVTPVRPTSQETRPGLSGGIHLRRKRRGGAPRGERAAQARAASDDAAMEVRLSALRLPSFYEGGTGNGLVRQNSDAGASRERCPLSAPAIAG